MSAQNSQSSTGQGLLGVQIIEHQVKCHVHVLLRPFTDVSGKQIVIHARHREDNQEREHVDANQ
jgi:hypothetical protein